MRAGAVECSGSCRLVVVMLTVSRINVSSSKVGSNDDSSSKNCYIYSFMYYAGLLKLDRGRPSHSSPSTFTYLALSQVCSFVVCTL